MKQYRKKPLVIQAIKWDGEKLEGQYPIAFFKKYNVDWHYGRAPSSGNLYELVIYALEGDMICKPGDWIIKGVNDEFYPCRPDVFELIYEEM